MNKAYISGKITDLPPQHVKTKFELAEARLQSLGFIPVNPLKICPFDYQKTWNDYMEADLLALWDCDYIFMLPCWKESKGAQIEHFVAKKLGLKILYTEKI